MDKYQLFKNQVKLAAEKFSTVKDECKVVSHYDTDGICSAALMINCLKGHPYSLLIVKQLTEEIVQQLDSNVIVFTDLGSGQLDLIIKHLGNKTDFILDHHKFDKCEIPENITLVNPHSFDIEGSDEISGAGVVYLLCEALNPKNKALAYLAIVGAFGDLQEKGGFLHLNKQILDTALNEGTVVAEKSIAWFGIETKPLYALLAHSTHPFIPGITGSESSAIQFLKELDIEPKNEDWTRFDDLSNKQKERLISAIIIRRANEDRPEDILGTRYSLVREPKLSPFRDLREFSTLLNACGRMDKAELGVGICLNDEKSKQQAVEILIQYKKEITSALNWYEEQKDSGHIIRGDKYIIINAEHKVAPSIIGTLSSIISNSGEKGIIVISLAQDLNNITKVSARIIGKSDVDLRNIIKQIVRKTTGQSGGHKNAAGALIPTNKEKAFIKEAKKILERLTL